MTNLFKTLILSQVLVLACTSLGWAKDYVLLSPDKKIQVRVAVNEDIRWSVAKSGEELLKPSALALHFTNGTRLGVNPTVQKTSKESVNKMITAVVPVRNRQIPDVYNVLHLHMKGGFTLQFRAYNDGAAYRFETNLPELTVEVKEEVADFVMGGNYQVYWPLEKDPNFQSHYEATFQDTLVSSIGPGTYGYLPLTFNSAKGTKVVITESDLLDYPNLFLFGTGSPRLTAAHPPVILASQLKPQSDRDEVITEKAPFIAKTLGKRTYPWRTLIVTDDKGLLETDMVYKLATPNVLPQTDWIKPGKVAWDWWNANNIYGVDFRAGINTETYKYYVDFAADYGLEYIILDEGWSAGTTNLMAPNKDLDVEALIKYADSKNVGVILWALWNVLDRDVEGILDQFAKWGAKGTKVDFMARGDQYMVNYYERVAIEAAKRKLLVDYHGAYKPVGLNRKYPNVINYEGLKGLENHKWSDVITPTHNVTLPFTRMVAGPMDYTPGAMVNAAKGNFRDIFPEPMSQGTRAHQAAMYVVYDSPLQMLADNPSNYRRDPEFTRFISLIPTVWDRTVALSAKSGEHVAVARKLDRNWYVGAMTNWNARSLDLDFSFLGQGRYRMDIVQDGPNADRRGEDHQIKTREVKKGEKVKVNLAPGGGWVAILTPIY